MVNGECDEDEDECGGYDVGDVDGGGCDDDDGCYGEENGEDGTGDEDDGGGGSSSGGDGYLSRNQLQLCKVRFADACAFFTTITKNNF